MNLLDSMRHALLKLEEANVAIAKVEHNLRAAEKEHKILQKFDDVEVYISDAIKTTKDELHYLEIETLAKVRATQTQPAAKCRQAATEMKR